LIAAALREVDEQLTGEIDLLHEGAIAFAQVTGDPSAAKKAKAVAKKILIA
jgi:hypothetical protein